MINSNSEKLVIAIDGPAGAGKSTIAKIIAETGASGIAAMGKVMGIAAAQLGGTAEGKTISTIVKKLLV